MRKQHLYSLLAAFAMTATNLWGTAVAATDSHHRLYVPIERQQAAPATQKPETSPPPRMINLQANLTQAYPTISANSDGSDVWPCFGRTTPNPDCPSVGNPSVLLPRGGIVMGRPAYTWALQNDDIIGFGLGNGVGCDALTNGTNGPPYTAGFTYRPCGQIFTSFEDDTGDSTDDLLQRIVVRQGSNVIYDSGIVDFGPAGPIAYPVDVVLYYDANFGFWPGAENGPNNGNCTATTNYPLTAATFPATGYVIGAGSTCQQPVAGPATFTTYTELATPQYQQVNGKACTSKGVASPCFIVKWTKKYAISQDFGIFLQ